MTVQLRMVARACPLCGSDDQRRVFAEADFDLERLDQFAFASRKLPEYMHLRLVECPACDLLYASPLPERDALVRLYDAAAFDAGDESEAAARTYGRLLGRIAGRLPGRGGALDVGTGDGAFLAELLRRGFSDVVGIEPSAAPIASAAPAVRPLIRHGVFDPERFAPASLALVTCFQTLEHVYDPLWLARAAHRLLRESGAAFFICHNRRAVSARLMGLRSPIFDIEHLQLFSPKSARSLLETAGFSDVTVRTVVNRYPLRYWMRLFPLPAAAKQRVLAVFAATGLGALPIAAPVGNLAVVGFKRGAAGR
jgi:SAM-dependent methyltransferase